MKPIINLDDRRFEELTAEAKDRLMNSVPELTQIAPGDPVHALVDVFAWLTETVLYRANLIPERQRQAFLNLLQISRRPAVPARGLVCVDATRKRTANLVPLLNSESRFSAGEVVFTSEGELQPTPLQLDIVIKEKIAADELAELGITLEQLRQTSPAGNAAIAFRPRHLIPGRDLLDMQQALDNTLYLGFSIPMPLLGHKQALLNNLAGIILNIGIAPADDRIATQETEALPRLLIWELAWRQQGRDDFEYLPLELVDDSSNGARSSGVARLRLPKDVSLLRAHIPEDPANAGLRNSPPEQPGRIKPEQMMFWLRLRCTDQPDLKLGYLAVNAVTVMGQGVVRDAMLGIGSGQPDQSVFLQQQNIADNSLQLDIEENALYQRWRQVDHFAASGPEDKVYQLDAAEGLVRFGDGLRGKRPPRGKRIRAAYFRHGGGSVGNLPAHSIKTLDNSSSGLLLRQEWPTAGGVDEETVVQAEQRIPSFLSHRNRAVTRDDFIQLAIANPVNPVAKAGLITGFLPGSSLATARFDVPGVVSIFVLPPAVPAIGSFPRTQAGLLKDLYQYLAERTLLGTELYVLSPEYVQVAVALRMQELDPQTRQQIVKAVEQTLLHFLWPLDFEANGQRGWRLGQGVEVNELRTIAGRVEGVRSIGDLQLYYQDNAKQWHQLSAGERLTLNPWQLPELTEISVQSGGPAEPPAPPVVVAGGPDIDVTELIPVPVVPDIC
jgi:hypothetical protein